jgi:hypothetical protein
MNERREQVVKALEKLGVASLLKYGELWLRPTLLLVFEISILSCIMVQETQKTPSIRK